MNSLEKSKIEKIINADVEEVIKNFTEQRKDAQSALVDKLEENPPASAVKLSKEIISARKISREAEKELSALGWRLTGYNDDKLEMQTHWNCDTNSMTASCKEVMNFSKETDKKIQLLKSLARKYSLKLFAGGENAEVEKLLASFNAEIAKLLK